MIEPGTPSVSRNTPPPVTQVQNTSTIAAQLIVNNSRNTGSLDIALLHTDLQRIDAQNPGLGLGVRMAIEAQLTPVQRGELARAETPVAATTPDTGDGPDVGTLALDLGQIALDIVGIFEPTPFADGSNTVVSLFRGKWGDAGLSALGIIPYIGDAAKLGKLGGWAKTVANAVDLAAGNPAIRKALEPALKKIADALGAIPDGVMRKLPQSAQDTLTSMKTKLDDLFSAGVRGSDEAVQATTTGSYRATVRGQEIVLEGVDSVPVNYVKRDRTEWRSLRSQFDGGVRRDFVQSLASDPQKVAALKRAGLDDAAIERLASGRVPQGWQVHHKLPLDDGGTNAFENLVLIKNDPYHIGLTNAQTSLVGDLGVGQSRQIDFPVPPGFVYPQVP